MNDYNPIHLVFFLEEPSAEVMLKAIMPKIFNNKEGIEVIYIKFDGKQDLQANINKKIDNYIYKNAKFIILQDQDSNDCKKLKERIQILCPSNMQNNKGSLLIRIACSELESFYLADLNAVEKAFDINLAKIKNKKKFRNPDNLKNAKEELIKITKNQYTEIIGSGKIAPYLDINNETSPSFKHLVWGIKTLLNTLV